MQGIHKSVVVVHSDTNMNTTTTFGDVACQEKPATQLLNLCEAAKTIDIDRRTFQAWVKKGLAPQPVVQSGKVWRFRTSDVIAFQRQLAGGAAA